MSRFDLPWLRLSPLFPCQCSDLNLPLDGGEQQKIGFKGIITVPKPIQFKSSIKDYSQVMPHMNLLVAFSVLPELLGGNVLCQAERSGWRKGHCLAPDGGSGNFLLGLFTAVCFGFSVSIQGCTSGSRNIITSLYTCTTRLYECTYKVQCLAVHIDFFFPKCPHLYRMLPSWRPSSLRCGSSSCAAAPWCCGCRHKTQGNAQWRNVSSPWDSSVHWRQITGWTSASRPNPLWVFQSSTHDFVVSLLLTASVVVKLCFRCTVLLSRDFQRVTWLKT